MGIQAAPEVKFALIQEAVRQDDNLWVIAQRFLGNGNRYMEIYSLNSDVIGNSPRSLKPGIIIKMPRRSSDQERG